MTGSDHKDHDILDLLRSRDGVPTTVCLSDGRRLGILNVAWGYDEGADCAHLTTNISPAREGASIDVCGTDDVLTIIDPQTGDVLYRAREQPR